jgi:hypothetical protein
VCRLRDVPFLHEQALQGSKVATLATASAPRVINDRITSLITSGKEHKLADVEDYLNGTAAGALDFRNVSVLA